MDFLPSDVATMAETYQRLYQDEDEDVAPLAGGAGRRRGARRAMLRAMLADGWPERPGREPSRTP
ncbi:hypothetical protein BE04_14990 [Sorangium cellulosum]|uniref:Uncharacterized protein n=1 Tax=Sorangium cellulosum TaxID=56 RepID=A0A150NZY6_SORCE|nr:hypothetical protein BE04_14990 [Sorangium cellulosum]